MLANTATTMSRAWRQDGFLFVRRDLDEAKSSEQENSFNSQQCVADFTHIATFRSKRIEQCAVITLRTGSISMSGACTSAVMRKSRL